MHASIQTAKQKHGRGKAGKRVDTAAQQWCGNIRTASPDFQAGGAIKPQEKKQRRQEFEPNN